MASSCSREASNCLSTREDEATREDKSTREDERAEGKEYLSTSSGHCARNSCAVAAWFGSWEGSYCEGSGPESRKQKKGNLFFGLGLAEAA
jgi:hypothetical protein